MQKVEGTEEKLTSDQLLDLFVNGSIDAVDSKDMTSKYSIADFHIGSGEKNSYSIGEKIDLDNDGENELIIRGTYGGVYFDARDNKVYALPGEMVMQIYFHILITMEKFGFCTVIV